MVRCSGTLVPHTVSQGVYIVLTHCDLQVVCLQIINGVGCCLRSTLNACRCSSNPSDSRISHTNRQISVLTNRILIIIPKVGIISAPKTTTDSCEYLIPSISTKVVL